MKTIVRILALFLLSAAPLLARATPAFRLPSEFLGYEIGSRFTSHAAMVSWFEHLAAASPRVRLEKYGETYEQRPLLHAIIASEQNLARLDQIRRATTALASPRTTGKSEAEAIAAEMPVVVWLAFGIHGDESSSSEAAMLVASRLAGDDPSARAILEQAVVIIDPVQNPDGRDRYTSWFRSVAGARPDPDPEAFEHFPPWPAGRYNHYLIDMNRDWAWGTQKETRARIAASRAWNPQVFVDFHEMGWSSSYFFPPDAAPINMNIDPETEKWLHSFGRQNAALFADRGWPFFVSERFDLFYPGYGDSWPSLRGAIGMTYEMAGGGRAGMAVRREDGSILTLADRVERHFAAAMRTLDTAAANRKELLLHTWRSLRRNLEAPETVFLIPPGSPHFENAIAILHRQGIEVGMLDRAATLRAQPLGGGEAVRREFPPGTAVISTAQPLGAVVHTLLERSPELSQKFIEEQRARIEADERDEFYDITAWSIPISHTLEAWTARETPSRAVSPWRPKSVAPFADDAYAWLIDGHDPNVYRAAGRLIASGVRFTVSDAAVTLAGERLGRGTIAIDRTSNGPTLVETLRGIQSESGARLIALEAPWVDDFVLGATHFRFVREPRIGLLAGEAADATSFGAIRHLLELDVEVPHTVLPADRLASIDLSSYRVLIIPDGGSWRKTVGKSGIERLQAWTRAGGTIVAIGGGAAFLREEDVALSAMTTTQAAADPEGAKGEERHHPLRVPGAAFRTTMNRRSYLTLGIPQPPNVLLTGSVALAPVAHKADNIVTIAADAPLVSGFAWPESLGRVAGSVYLALEHAGSGRVVTFADEPNFRLFWRSTMPPFLNAVLYSPSFPPR